MINARYIKKKNTFTIYGVFIIEFFKFQKKWKKKKFFCKPKNLHPSPTSLQELNPKLFCFNVVYR